MKKQFYKYLLVSCSLLLGLSACTKEYYTTEEITNQNNYEIGPEVKNFYYSVSIDGEHTWEWNEANARYECFVNIPELSKNIYDYGTMIGNIFVNPGQNDEWQEMLPYTAVYYYTNDADEQIPYSVILSCGFTPGQVGFFLQLSDRVRDDNILDVYEFKVTLLWDEANIPKD